MAKKITVAVLFGGRSAEHEVSVRSARTVVSALDPQKYDVKLIGIDRRGKWLLDTPASQLLAADQVSATDINATALAASSLLEQSLGKIDVIFPVLHGPYGEDGTIQGLAKLANIPCVGAGVLGSAIGMDKDVMKRLLKEAGITVAKCRTVRFSEKSKLSFDEIKNELGMPVFIKPANMGSSVGVNKASTEQEFTAAVEAAFQYDRKIIIEEAIVGREIECSVLGNDEPKASLPGEVVSNDDFYTYDSKYSSNSSSEIKIPAELTEQQIQEIQEIAVKAYTVLECRGMARADFFLATNGQWYLNEINTIPGFTSISMYPKMWEASGLPLNQLVDTLIALAIEDFQQQANLLTAPLK